MVDARKKIRAALGYAGISQAELARRLGISPQVLSKRLQSGRFTLDEWGQIAAALGADFRAVICFNDGLEV